MEAYVSQVSPSFVPSQDSEVKTPARNARATHQDVRDFLMILYQYPDGTAHPIMYLTVGEEEQYVYTRNRYNEHQHHASPPRLDRISRRLGPQHVARFVDICGRILIDCF